MVKLNINFDAPPARCRHRCKAVRPHSSLRCPPRAPETMMQIEALIYSPRLQFYSVLFATTFPMPVSGLTAAQSAARLDNR